MILVMPKAWHEQRAILKQLGGLENDSFEDVTIITPDIRNVEMKSQLTAKELAYLTGLSELQCKHFMELNNLSGDDALEMIDIFMQSLNENISVPVTVASCLNNAGIYTDMATRLSSYNTMRGGVKGYGGFVFEELHAADAATKGTNIEVLGNNGIADFIIRDNSGKEILVQAKAGYHPKQIDWHKYEGQTIVIDKGNNALIKEAQSAGLKVEESAIFKKQADVVARTQQLESKILCTKNAPITGSFVSAHTAGLASAKIAARVGVSMKMGESIYDVISGNKDFSKAAADVAVDGIVLVGGAYFGSAALTTAGIAANTVATALSGTVLGSAVTGSLATATAALGNTAIGGAAIASAGTVATAASTVVAGVASAPLAPIIIGGAAIGFIGNWIKDNF